VVLHVAGVEFGLHIFVMSSLKYQWSALKEVKTFWPLCWMGWLWQK